MRLPEDISSEDVSQWLGNCWFLVRGALARYSDVTRDTIYYYAERDGEQQCAPFYDVEVKWPQLGCVNVRGVGALYVQRRPARQWRRAYHARSVNVSVPISWERRAESGNDTLFRLSPDGWQLVEALFDPWYPTMTEAKELLKKLPNVAVSRQIILEGADADSIRVYYNDEPVGMLTADGEFKSSTTERVARRVRKLIGVTYG